MTQNMFNQPNCPFYYPHIFVDLVAPRHHHGITHRQALRWMAWWGNPRGQEGHGGQGRDEGDEPWATKRCNPRATAPKV